MLAIENSRCVSPEDAIDDKKWDSGQEGIDGRKMQKIVIVRRRDELNGGVNVLPERQVPDKEPQGRQ